MAVNCERATGSQPGPQAPIDSSKQASLLVQADQSAPAPPPVPPVVVPFDPPVPDATLPPPPTPVPVFDSRPPHAKNVSKQPKMKCRWVMDRLVLVHASHGACQAAKAVLVLGGHET